MPGDLGVVRFGDFIIQLINLVVQSIYLQICRTNILVFVTQEMGILTAIIQLIKPSPRMHIDFYIYYIAI